MIYEVKLCILILFVILIIVKIILLFFKIVDKIINRELEKIIKSLTTQKSKTKITYDDEVEDYINNRLINQQKWHSKKSTHFKNCYNKLKSIEIFLGAIIPLISLTPHFKKCKNVIIAFIGCIITFINCYIEHKKFHELWIDYRKLSEGLKREEKFFRAKVGIYDCEPNLAYKHLVENVENMLSVQNDLWRTVVSKECNIEK